MSGNNFQVGGSKNSQTIHYEERQSRRWYLKWVFIILLILLALLLGGKFIPEISVPGVGKIVWPGSNENVFVATSTLNISDIFSRYNALERGIDRQIFIQEYNGTVIYGTGVLEDISGRPSEGEYLLHLKVGGGRMSCAFEGADADTQRRINLLALGSRITLTGIFTDSVLAGTSRWYIQNCALVN